MYDYSGVYGSMNMYGLINEAKYLIKLNVTELDTTDEDTYARLKAINDLLEKNYNRTFGIMERLEIIPCED